MDTIKTRLVTQFSTAAAGGGVVPYKGIIDCAMRIAKEEGVQAFYRGIAPRLISVVPMIGIQFGVYEAMKKVMLRRNTVSLAPQRSEKWGIFGDEEVIEEVAMEVAASHGNPFPAPQFKHKICEQEYESKQEKTSY